jgi:hypothetical protein
MDIYQLSCYHNGQRVLQLKQRLAKPPAQAGGFFLLKLQIMTTRSMSGLL